MSSSPDWLIKNASVLHAELSHFDETQKSDLWIQDGKIKAIERSGTLPESVVSQEQVLDASQCWVLPGLIDAHVHLREPGLEHKETLASGSRAAVAGGFTSVACMANTLPVNDNAAITRSILARAQETAVCRVYPVGAITRGLQGKELADIGLMIEAGAVALSDDGMPVMNSALMRRALDYAKSFSVPVICHAEDLHLSHGGCMHEGAQSFKLGIPGIPAASEEIAVAREIALCRLTGAKVHLAHLSTKEAVELVRRAKADGLPITAEATPHHLALSDRCWESYSTFCKMNPPLRTAQDIDAITRALGDGTIDLIATDHAPHALGEKLVELRAAPNGVIGLQTAVPLTLSPVWSGQVSPLRWIDSLTLSPARMLGIPGGRLAPGQVADLCVLDPHLRWRWDPIQNFSLSSNLPPLGEAGITELRGKIRRTFVGGQCVFQDEDHP